jgi:hypothetical protein
VLLILPGAILSLLHRALVFSIEHSAATAEQAASRVAGFNSFLTLICSIIGSVMGLILVIGTIPLVGAASTNFLSEKPLLGWLVALTSVIALLMTVMFEAGWVRNHLDHMAKEERDYWRFGWMTEFVLATPMLFFVHDLGQQGKDIGTMVFSWIAGLCLCLAWLGFFVGGLFSI